MENILKPAPGPLVGTVVVEIGGSLSAPFGAQILADLGAEVIKVEPLAGDDARKWGAPILDGSSCSFHVTNRGKYSVVADFQTAADRQRVTDLIVERADIVIQNMRPGLADRIGLGAETLRGLKPALIYCNIGAFGRLGPLASRPGYDPLMQAFSGIMSVVGEEGNPPVRVGPALVDMGSGMWAVIGILSAMTARHASGVGATVDVSLFETAVTWMMGYTARFMATGDVAKRLGSGQIGIAPYRAFAAKDGDLVIAAGNDGLYRKLCSALDRAEWVSDPRFATNSERYQNRAALNALIEDLIRQETVVYWLEVIEAAGVPCAPIHNVQQMAEHAQTAALGMIQEVPGHFPMAQVMLPVSFDGERPRVQRGAPRLGEHTDLVFGEPVQD